LCKGARTKLVLPTKQNTNTRRNYTYISLTWPVYEALPKALKITAKNYTKLAS
jgi:hypothetical protein